MQINYIRWEYFKPYNMYKLFVLNENTWNNITLCKLIILDKNFKTTYCVQIILLDRNTWNNITQCKLTILVKNT